MQRSTRIKWMIAIGAAGALLASCSLANPEIPPTPTPFALPTLAPSETPVLPTGDASDAAGCTTDGAFLNEVVNPRPVAPGAAFAVTWRLGNSGTCPWQGVVVLFAGGNQMGRAASVTVPPTTAGGEAQVTVNLIAPIEEGEYTGVWQLALADGTPFGARPYVRVVVDANLAGGATPKPGADDGETEEAVDTEGCELDVVFVADLTIPDDTEIPPGETFTKTWRLRNTSLCDWSLGYRLVFESGALMGANGTVALPPVKAGSDFDVSVDFVAPTAPGKYTSRWQIVGPDDEPFGNTPFARIVVPASNSENPATPTATPTAEG